MKLILTFGVMLAATNAAAQIMPTEPPQSSADHLFDERSRTDPWNGSTTASSNSVGVMSPARQAKLTKAQAEKAAAAKAKADAAWAAAEAAAKPPAS